jgi:hypothetical protein
MQPSPLWGPPACFCLRTHLPHPTRCWKCSNLEGSDSSSLNIFAVPRKGRHCRAPILSKGRPRRGARVTVNRTRPSRVLIPPNGDLNSAGSSDLLFIGDYVKSYKRLIRQKPFFSSISSTYGIKSAPVSRISILFYNDSFPYISTAFCDRSA